MRLEGTRWDPTEISARATPGWLGLLVIEGVLIRSVSVTTRTASELIGPGDLIRPWDADAEYPPLPVEVGWRIVRPTRLAVLDADFARRVARWPTVTSAIAGRVASRARSLALGHAVSHLPRADSRLLILFWLLAERWGTVRPDGVHITLSLTHEVLATLIGVRRPAVTLALQRLTDGGLVSRSGSGGWLLRPDGLEQLPVLR
jgi:CRP/FNR family transcriptional regulator, cyclic AMP receptor protein